MAGFGAGLVGSILAQLIILSEYGVGEQIPLVSLASMILQIVISPIKKHQFIRLHARSWVLVVVLDSRCSACILVPCWAALESVLKWDRPTRNDHLHLHVVNEVHFWLQTILEEVDVVDVALGVGAIVEEGLSLEVYPHVQPDSNVATNYCWNCSSRGYHPSILHLRMLCHLGGKFYYTSGAKKT
eukprot:15366436-Ditylum_brightwellii.AAC.2